MLLLGCPSTSESDDSDLLWIIPVAIVAGLLILGIIALLIIKLCLLILVSSINSLMVLLTGLFDVTRIM